MADTPLKKFDDSVRLVDAPDEKTEIEHAGPAGFKLKNHMRMFPWFERNRTWTSDKLDRIDATRTQFSNAAKCGERTTP
jgi:hypothetical protein